MPQNYKRYAQISNRMRKTSKSDKKNMLSAADYRCERCGMSLRRMPSRIFHKNGKQSDNRKSNVMIVCTNCFDELTGNAPRDNVEKPMQKTRERIKKFEHGPWWKFW